MEEVTQVNILETLPQDMLVEIFSRVGQDSSEQLFIRKLISKSFLKLFVDHLVCKRMSLDRWDLVPWRNPKMDHIIRRCYFFGNPNAIFRRGLINYFDKSYTELGLRLLEEAANSQIIEAVYVYVYGLIMFASHQIEAKHVGLQVLNKTFPPVPGLVVAVRTKVFHLLHDLWLFNSRPFDDVATRFPISGHKDYFPHIRGSGFEMRIPECMSCFWAYELGVFAYRFGYSKLIKCLRILQESYKRKRASNKTNNTKENAQRGDSLLTFVVD
ncbi:putative F-box protein At1g67623 [Rutidosis leptorrhynchoides]|uniref:putative F-box protein At1g67623 n=1 Tax=Rutidosis leptorrhynchoides TaxID=125765 RepID=UPI003A99E6D8